MARLLPKARLVEPPWGESERLERSAARAGGKGSDGLFVRWPLLARLLQAWAEDELG